VLALVTIVVGTVEAFFRGLWTLVSSASGHERRDVWLRYARWLVAGLTFQLGADILQTAVTESWDAVGRIAAIRTFLNYFLERDLGEVRQRQDQPIANRYAAAARATALRNPALTSNINPRSPMTC
jgi:uncharacterized membrane protein